MILFIVHNVNIVQVAIHPMPPQYPLVHQPTLLTHLEFPAPFVQPFNAPFCIPGLAPCLPQMFLLVHQQS